MDRLEKLVPELVPIAISQENKEAVLCSWRATAVMVEKKDMKKKPKKFDWNSLGRGFETKPKSKKKQPLNAKKLWLVWDDYRWKAVDNHGTVYFEDMNLHKLKLLVLISGRLKRARLYGIQDHES